MAVGGSQATPTTANELNLAAARVRRPRARAAATNIRGRRTPRKRDTFQFLSKGGFNYVQSFGHIDNGSQSLPHAGRRAKLRWAAEQRCQRKWEHRRGHGRAR